MKAEEVSQEVTQKCAALTALKFFPQEPEAEFQLVLAVCRMAEKMEQVDWLIARMLSLFDEWPGPRTMRAVFCRRFRPADGIEANVSIEEAGRWEAIAEPEVPGIPRIAAQEAPALAAGKVDADPSVRREKLEILLENQRDKQKTWDAPATPEEIATAPDWLRRLEGYE